MPVSARSAPPILVIVRESPLRQRTTALLDSILRQEPTGLAQVVVLRVRRPEDTAALGDERIIEIMEERDWLRQASRLIAETDCRWVVLPSSLDRYMPGAFETVVKTGADDEAAVVVGCRVTRDGRSFRIGPNPFRFDYYALLAGWSYVPPGAVFVSTGRLQREGFDERFPDAVTFEYLLRTGAAHGVASCEGPLLETAAEPFPGIPAEAAALYATEVTSVALHYNRTYLAPGATLGLVGVLAQRLEPVPYTDYYDERLRSVLDAGGSLTDRYLEYVGLEEDRSEGQKRRLSAFREELPFAGLPSGAPESYPLHVRLALWARGISPRPLWNTLKRVKRAWKALRDPV